MAEDKRLEHQKRVAEKLKKTDALLVYHGMGSGKTLSALAAAEDLGMKLTTIGPASLKKTFAQERKKHKVKVDIESFSYAKPPEKIQHELLVFDEVHRTGQLTSKRSVYPEVYRAKKKLLLTGTPIRNRPSELIPIMRGLGIKTPRDVKAFQEKYIEIRKHKPGLLGRLRGIKPGETRHAKNLDILKAKFRGKIDYHMPKYASDYPTITKENISVEMSALQQKTYDTFLKGRPSIRYKIRQGLPPSRKESKNMNAFLSAARQISNTPKGFNLKAKPKDAPKLNRIVSEIQEHMKKDKNYRGFTYSTYLGSGINPLSKRLTKAGISHSRFTGEMTSVEKADVVKKYNTGAIKHLLVSGAGAEGLDLKKTKLIQITEPAWHKPAIEQIKARGIRYKSHAGLPKEQRKVRIQTFISKTRPTRFLKKQHGSTDEYMTQLSERKHRLTQQFLTALKEVGSE
jgi:SNF2 family DNA or RNA helicase